MHFDEDRLASPALRKCCTCSRRSNRCVRLVAPRKERRLDWKSLPEIARARMAGGQRQRVAVKPPVIILARLFRYEGEHKSQEYVSGTRVAEEADHHRDDPRPRSRPVLGRQPLTQRFRTAGEGRQAHKNRRPPVRLRAFGRTSRSRTSLPYALNVGRGAHGNGLSSVSISTKRTASVSHWPNGAANF